MAVLAQHTVGEYYFEFECGQWSEMSAASQADWTVITTDCAYLTSYGAPYATVGVGGSGASARVTATEPLFVTTTGNGNNVYLENGVEGQILRYNATTELWELYSGTTDGHVLTWDTTNGWQAEAPSGGTLADGDYGDITVSGTGTVMTIDPAAVTYAKIQNVSAASKLLGRGDSGAGTVEEITLGTGLTMTGTTLSAATGTVTGTGTSPRVALWTGATSLGDDSDLTFDGTNLFNGTSYQTHGTGERTFQKLPTDIFFLAEAGNGTATGNNSIGIGKSALLSLTSGLENVAIGNYAAQKITTTGTATHIGYAAGAYNTGINTSFGSRALLGVDGVSTGGGNVAIGRSCMYAVTTAQQGTGVGDEALRKLTTGNYSTAIGKSAMYETTTAHGNTAIGYAAGYWTNANYNVFVGYETGQYTTGTYNVHAGMNAGRFNTGSRNILLGAFAGIGVASGTPATGSDNTLIGYNSGNDLDTGQRLVSVGSEALEAITTGNNCVAVGYQALETLTTGGDNVAVGTYALQYATAGGHVAIGYLAGRGVLGSSTGLGNVFIGKNVGSNFTTAATCTAVGYLSFSAATTVANATALGYEALKEGTTGHTDCVAVGATAGKNTNAAENTFVGTGAGFFNTTGAGNTAVGKYAQSGTISHPYLSVPIMSHALRVNSRRLPFRYAITLLMLRCCLKRLPKVCDIVAPCCRLSFQV